MARELKVSIGQHSDKGRKPVNQDFYGASIPTGPALASKGIAIAVADGVSSSDVSHVAAESAVKALMTDYYCTSDAWSVKTGAQRVIAATNSWLHGQTLRSRHRYDRERGYVCTLTALIVKSATAHLFHVGDCRIYRLAGDRLEQLTEDHRVRISAEENYLGRALGVNRQVEIDYRSLPVAAGDTFVLATDGAYEFVADDFVARSIAGADDLDRAAGEIVEEALRRGSDDNVTVQIVRIEATPEARSEEAAARGAALPLPPLLEAREKFDGYTIVRELKATHRSHVYLATDDATGERVVLKTPSIDLSADADHIRRFMMEEWVARRIDSPHVLKAYAPDRRRAWLYGVLEYVEGQSLSQWMVDHPRPDLEAVRDIVEQIGTGLRAMHRREMIHQDLRPDNVLIDRTGTAKIIDFGSTRVAGVAEAEDAPHALLGTAQYAAPEYFVGEPGSSRSDIFSLGVIAYQMLTGRLPYGAEVARRKTKAVQRKLRYAPAATDDNGLPTWIDTVIEKAVHVDPNRRYREVSEFMSDLRKPGPAILDRRPRPLIERNPLVFWKLLSFVLAAVVVVLVWRLLR
jgi:serine/threonine protein phosphatase PrpC